MRNNCFLSFCSQPFTRPCHAHQLTRRGRRSVLEAAARAVSGSTYRERGVYFGAARADGRPQQPTPLHLNLATRLSLPSLKAYGLGSGPCVH